MTTTIALAVEDAARNLRGVAGEEAFQQARLLVAHAVGKTPAMLAAYRGEALLPSQEEALFAILQRRMRAEPLQYILGEWAFMGLPIRVRSGALIPRQDTETLCEHALKLAGERGYRTALDLCCGSGCIGVALARLGGLLVTASDYDSACVGLTMENARLNGVAIECVQGDLFAPLGGRQFDLIVSNPPYLNDADMRDLQPELRYEPERALYGGADGLQFYRAIADAYRPYLATGGVLLLEVGIGQAGPVAALFDEACGVYEDLNGIQRVVCVCG